MSQQATATMTRKHPKELLFHKSAAPPPTQCMERIIWLVFEGAIVAKVMM
jgi:hypothetical protein